MPFFRLIYERSLDFIIEAPSLDEAKRAAEEHADDHEGWLNEDDYAVHVTQLTNQKGPHNIDMGVINGELLEISDYKRAKAAAAALAAGAADAAAIPPLPGQTTLFWLEREKKEEP